MQTLVLSGYRGFLGNILREELSAVYEIITMGRDEQSGPFFDLLSDDNPMPDLHGDYIMLHAAGMVHLDPKNKKEEALFYETNVAGTRRLLEKLGSYPPKAFIFISSVAVYGLDAGTGISEETPLAATAAYGKSKIAAEQMIRAWCAERAIPLGILRLPLVYGPAAPGNLQRMIRAIDRKRYVRIGKGDARKSMVNAMDIATIIPALVSAPGIYHLTDTCHPSLKELEEAIASCKGTRIRSIPYAFAKLLALTGDLLQRLFPFARIPFHSRTLLKLHSSLTFDDSKARQVLHWQPRPVTDEIRKS
jgi:nucleoside-diphosphate-sugar epimerase